MEKITLPEPFWKKELRIVKLNDFFIEALPKGIFF
jgi:hypothetical protein